MDFKEILRWYMGNKDVSVKDLAGDLGVSRQQVHKYLNGSSCPSFDKVMEYLRTLRLEMMISDLTQRV